MRVLNHTTQHRTGKELFKQIERTSYDWRWHNKSAATRLEIELTPYEWSLLREHLHYSQMLRGAKCSHRYHGIRDAVGELFGAILLVREQDGPVEIEMHVDGWKQQRTIDPDWHRRGYFKVAVCGGMKVYAVSPKDTMMDTVEMKTMEFRRTDRRTDTGRTVYELI